MIIKNKRVFQRILVNLLKFSKLYFVPILNVNFIQFVKCKLVKNDFIGQTKRTIKLNLITEESTNFMKTSGMISA